MINLLLNNFGFNFGLNVVTKKLFHWSDFDRFVRSILCKILFKILIIICINNQFGNESEIFDLTGQVSSSLHLSSLIFFISASATQSIRTFGKSVDHWLRFALTNLPKRLKTIKLTVIHAFAMTLRRYTSLNHLAQAARAVPLFFFVVLYLLFNVNE